MGLQGGGLGSFFLRVMIINGCPARLRLWHEEGPGAASPPRAGENCSAMSSELRNEALLVREAGGLHPDLGCCSGVWRELWDLGGVQE